jgi:ubiquinone biosynthesis protein COQ9
MTSSDALKSQLLAAALPHVAFDGWTDLTFNAAIADAGIDEATARSICPKGALDLAITFHLQGDAAMRDAMKAMDLTQLRYSEKVEAAVRARIEAIPDKEAVRRGSTLFALPQNAPEGAKLIWGTADAIWDVLGDTSEDVNWYTKRATLSGVYGSTILFWLGDQSPDHQATWDFLNRRISNVMQFEKLKGQVRGNPLFKPLFAGPDWILSKVKAPTRMPRVDLPGHWTGQTPE